MPHPAQTEAAQKAHQTSDYIPLSSLAQCEKQHAMFMFNVAAASFATTQDEFRRHPRWKSA